eukprot:TRINITY_DN14961_c0_g1_i1.p1 TRINITY_DN14961_c0_g1~~TRINITY_DN14961_c0_g1_i1.p1  ORF type:complete len:104 (-),score=28.93 TRINITY_DN14961_c0_g1_i1:207-518(-)
MQREQHTEALRVQLLESSVLDHKAQGTQLRFQLSELQAQQRRAARHEPEHSTGELSITVQPEVRVVGGLGVLFQKGPLGEPFWFTLYVVFLHFLLWYFKRGCL